MRRVQVSEVDDADKPPLLHAYLGGWARETSAMFGADGSTSLEELAKIAGDHPVFRVDE